MSKDINSKIDGITNGSNLSNSQVDRIVVDPKIHLMNYLTGRIGQIQTVDPLIQKIKDDFTDRYEEMTEGAKLRLLELLLKKETEDNTPLINLFAKALENKKEPEKPTSGDGETDKPGTGYSKEDITNAKKFLNMITKIEQGEFTSGENK